MSAYRLVFCSALIPIVLSAAACKGEKENILYGYNKEAAVEVRQLMAAELNVGDEASDIESFFEKNGIDYSYDRFSQRYQAIIRDVSTNPTVDQAVVINVAVDRQKRLLSYEVRDSFTAP